MGIGGAEVWLMNVMRRIDRERFHFDFFVHRREAGEFDEEIRRMGSSVTVASSHKAPVRYANELRRCLAGGNYDVVHSHVSFYSAYPLAISRVLGVRSRIAHSHTSVPEKYDSPARRVYKRAMRRLLFGAATRGLGCSSKACDALFGDEWRRRDGYDVLFYGYEFERFARATPVARRRVRAELGVRDDQVLVGQIGRLVTPKNHEFTLRLVAESARLGRNEYFVFVGDGELRPKIEADIASQQLGHKVALLGRRADIPELLAAFDVLILPSLWEGLPVTVIEAQAVGVPCIISDLVTDEVIYHDNVVQLSLDEPGAWLSACDSLLELQRPSAAAALDAMRSSPFSIDEHVRRIEGIYLAETAR